MTRRERLDRKLEKRHEWAESRERKSNESFNKARAAIRGIEPGQPILVGHHSEGKHRRALERHDSAMHSAIESADMAKHHESKAEGIERQLNNSIFSDDSDAMIQLKARIAEREAEAARIVAYNKSARKAAKAGEQHGDLSLLDESQKRDFATTLRVCPYQIRNGAFPSYALSNLRGRITADKKRLEQIERQAQRQAEAEAAPNGVVITGEDYVSVRFAEKPEREILNALREAGFHWGGGCWGGYRAKLPECVKELV